MRYCFIFNTKENDFANKELKARNWSGHEVLIAIYFVDKINKIKKSLMEKFESMWEPGYFGLVNISFIHQFIKYFLDSSY